MATSISIQNINEVEVHASVIAADLAHDGVQREWLKLTLRTGNTDTTIDLLLEDVQLAGLRGLRDDLTIALNMIIKARVDDIRRRDRNFHAVRA